MKYLEAEISMGVFRKVDISREPEPIFFYTIMLVPRVESRQKYHVWSNLVEAKRCIWSSAIYLPEYREVLDMGGHIPILSALDKKSGFYNILVAEELL